MRLTHALLVMLAGVLILPNLTWSQGPGGGGRMGGGGFSMNPDDSFNRFSGGKDVIVISELDDRQKMFVPMIMQRMGLSGDRITREQWRTASNNMMQQFAQGGGGMRIGAPVGGPGGPGGGPGGGGFGGPGGPGGPGGRPGPADGPAFDQYVQNRFQRLDKDQDGFLNVEEMGADETLLRERETWDKNHDGLIDLNEYKAYQTARANQRAQAQADAAKAAEAQGSMGDQPQQQIQEEKRPTVYRAGNLPKDIPEWFIQMDRNGDNDGQVGLYEWRKSTRPLEEFYALDLNGDGFITAEEYLRWKAKNAPKRAEGDAVAQGGTSQQQPQFGMGGFQMPQFGGGNFQFQFGQGAGGFPGMGMGGGRGQGGGFPGMGQGGGFPGMGQGGGGFMGGGRGQGVGGFMGGGQGQGFPGMGGQGVGGFMGGGRGQGGGGFMGGGQGGGNADAFGGGGRNRGGNGNGGGGFTGGGGGQGGGGRNRFGGN
jgi:Ca2+-binding EF-hand superfamily protein